MSAAAPLSSRGRTWFDALADGAQRVETGLGSLLVADATLTGERVRLLAVVPDPRNRFPRARHMQVVAAEVIVMPRSCSCSIQSITAAPSCTSPIL